jgi:glycosyltransferase involved in cell wall biosynthesis
MTAAQAKVSVIIAAFDMARWPLLVRALTSARDQCPAPEVVVAIDNNQSLFDRASTEFAGVTVVLNRGDRGASATRNARAAAATGDILAFLDDDAEANADWLEKLVAPLIQDPSVIGVGGGVLPSWPANAPSWFPMEFGWVVGGNYIGLPTHPAPVRNVWSENMAVRASDFHRVGGFREGFGKVGDASWPEDTEFCVRIQAAHPDTHWLHEPEALIRHHVPQDRATLAFFMRRCYAEDRGKADLAEYVGQSLALATERAYVARTLARGAVRGVGQAFRGDVTGLARSGAIVLGGTLAALGYSMRTGYQVRRKLRRRMAPGRHQ